MEEGQAVNILAVDDRPENLSALEAITADMGLNVVRATSGKQALKLLLNQDFALILLDVKMPDMDGFETARLIRERDRTKHTPIIFLTAMHTEDADARRGYSLGAVDYLVKPFSPEILKCKIGVFVDLYKKTEEARQHAERLRLVEQREFEARLLQARRQMEEESYRARAEHRIAQAILQHAPVGILRTDKDFTILELNRRLCAELGIGVTDLVGRNLFEALPWLSHQQVLHAIDAGQRFFAEQLKIEPLCKDTFNAQPHYLDLAVWPVTAEQEGVIGTVLLAVDVTERVRLAQQREDFVATLAHDLQTPLVAADRALELLLDQLSDSPQSRLLSMLRNNNRDLLQMIQSLLELYRYEAGVPLLYIDKLSVQLVVHSCVDELTPLAQEHGVSISVDLMRNLRVVSGDRIALRRVIMNLLDNAIKFTPRGGTITVKARNDGDSVLLEISNPGDGISPEDLSQLFERYWHKPTRQGGKASCGLGLYLCKQIVDAHGGRIECESEPAQVTTFKVRLPAAKAPQPDDQDNSEAPLEASSIRGGDA